MPNITLDLGNYRAAYENTLDKARTERVVERIWQRDHTVWAPQPDEISNRLGWLDVAERMQAEVPDLQAFAAEAQAAGFRRALVLGMGGSSLAPELYADLFGGGDGLAVSILDSTDPAAVRAAEAAHPLSETLYIVSSKSGGTVETFSFFKYFYNRALDALGVGQAGRHFVAITDPGSGLAQTAEQYGFRRTFLADPNIGGRYSALSHFGLVPAALAGADLSGLLARAQVMAERCRDSDLAHNPGARLGLALGALAQAGKDKLTLRLPAGRAGFGDWVEQLIAESTGKRGRGILPVVGEPVLPQYGEERAFVQFSGAQAAPSGQTRIEVDWQADLELGGQFFLWEFATAVASYILGVNPFDQPDVEAAKVQARQFVQAYQESGTLPAGVSAELSRKTLDDFLAGAKPGDYIALQAYLAAEADTQASLQALREQLGEQTGLATTLGYGPRFLHSTGQLHKGDAGHGLFIQLVSPPPQPDLPIPNQAGQSGSQLGFGALKAAQALGDAQALRSAGRRVLTLTVNDTNQLGSLPV